MNKYQRKYVKMIEAEYNSGNDQDGLCAIIDKIYEDGFSDAENDNKDAYFMEYESMRYHIGHKLELNDIWDWETNREIGLEIKCANKKCDDCEPIFTIDIPK